jgi:ornithine cyclodeaminase/alanine dehydrogenase-like protein (mu-crystallin family)
MTMAAAPIYLTEADVGSLVTVEDAIATLEELFATWGQGATANLPRQRARLPGGAFNLMGAAYGAKGVHGLKAYAGLKGGQFHTLLYSSSDGRLKAMIEADLFGQMRTGAASGLATRLLARADAKTLAVIGTGRQSRTQALAVCAVRPIKRVNVFARTAEHRESYARAMEKELGVEVVPVPSGEACVADADVVVTITKSAEPVCRAAWLAPGAHVNAAGANSADRREVDAETVLRAAVKLTDHLEQAKVEAGEFRDLVAAGKLAWSDIRELGELVTGKAKGRRSASELTLFKSLGIALEDVAFAQLVYQSALAAGAGRPIPV